MSYQCLTTVRKMSSLIRHRFSKCVEKAINAQINTELHASYVYLSMAYHFDRSDVAMKGMSNFFKKASEEELGHAQMFMKYLNQRGGKIILEDIEKPKIKEIKSPEDAMCIALELEKSVNDDLLNLHAIGTEQVDPDFCDFLETNMLHQQIESIKDIGDHITRLQRLGPGVGEHIYDGEIKFTEFTTNGN